MSRSSTLSCSPFLTVSLTEAEWLDLLKRETALYPEIFRFNIENQQWDLMEKNLLQLAESIEQVRRILGAKLSEANNQDEATA